MLAFSVGIFNGLGIGIEHVDGDEEDEYHVWSIIVDILFFRFSVSKFKDEEE